MLYLKFYLKVYTSVILSDIYIRCYIRYNISPHTDIFDRRAIFSTQNKKESNLIYYLLTVNNYRCIRLLQVLIVR